MATFTSRSCIIVDASLAFENFLCRRVRGVHLQDIFVNFEIISAAIYRLISDTGHLDLLGGSQEPIDRTNLPVGSQTLTDIIRVGLPLSEHQEYEVSLLLSVLDRQGPD